MRRFVALAVISATLLSGCGEPDDAAAVLTTSSSSTPLNFTMAPRPNHAPSVELAVDSANGTAPLNVTFSLGGDDADGDALNWTLDADGDGTPDGNGTGLPATVKFTYAAAGDFTVNFTVTDGKANATKTASVSVVAVILGPNYCHVTPAQTVGDFYYTDVDGNWVFMESNGVPGLQVGNTSPLGPDGGGVGEANANWAACEDGDQMIF